MVAELEAERNRPAPGTVAGDDDDDWAVDGPPLDVRYLTELTELREREKDRRDFARDIEERVAELERADARLQSGQQHTLDWTGWTERIEHLIGVIATGDPATRPGIVWNARQRLATALAEAATMLGELETTPPAADIPADVTGYLARDIWTGAAGIVGGPLVTSYASLAKQLHLTPEAARRALTELHRAGRVKLYRYFHGRQSEVDPAHLHEQATFHLILIGDCEDAGHPRPTVIVDL
ncbi:hypothetical protein OIE67_16015 [Nonomuraea fuscirosea]|uniref:hypothetical protein n=1 Tax=Nonomuraea fuscirosea TaxID=1291556 RepID=UPI002DD7A8D9|nr:hypothetical protein [Nonomuraea fuscirosea]WSA56051.1 hypothetical protein OIE67_16015 [Nonomuraea fuscirosea]